MSLGLVLIDSYSFECMTKKNKSTFWLYVQQKTGFFMVRVKTRSSCPSSFPLFTDLFLTSPLL